jgi:hypothetical protein
MILPKITRKETDFVYNFYNTETAVEESEKREIHLSFNVGPKASKAS